MAGRVAAFFTYGFGDAYPVPFAPMGQDRSGGGVENGRNQGDLIPKLDANGCPIRRSRGRSPMMRVRSGYIPNVLSLGSKQTSRQRDHVKGAALDLGHDRIAPP